MIKKSAYLMLSLGLLLNGCTWVTLSGKAGQVEIRKPHTVTHCQRLGTASASSPSKLGIIRRSEDTVRDEVQTLARNRATEMGGNVIVPETELTQGEQRFAVYRCP